ncbi:MAG: hypothetical protein ABIP20_07680 [Chthoniobacteraceae bacterium]
MKSAPNPMITLACCALFAAAGCKQKTSSATGGIKSELTASTGGRDLHVISDNGAWVNQRENEFIVKMVGHEIIIDRVRVLVDKKEGVKVPGGAKKFEVSFIGGTLTLGADGTEILKTPLAK